MRLKYSRQRKLFHAGITARTDGPFPLTPALSRRERENCSQSHGGSSNRVCVTVIGKNGEPRMLFPLPEGEGQGEGKRTLVIPQGRNLTTFFALNPS